MIDSAAVVVELGAYIASKPAHGRQDLLVVLAELQAKHRVPEDEMDRALRLSMPALLDLLFNRAPELAQAVRRVLSEDELAAAADDHGIVRRDAELASPSIAA